MNLVRDRESWRKLFESGFTIGVLPEFLYEYKKNRNSEYFRLSQSVEKLCEYIVYLEEQMQNSEHKEYKNKIKELQESLNNSHTKCLHNVTRIVNMAPYLDEETKEKLLDAIWELVL